MTSAEGSERDVAVSNSAFAAATIVSSATRDASGPGAGRGGNAPRRETAPPREIETLATSVLGQRVVSFLPSRTAPSSPSSSSSSSHSSQTRSARSPAIASTASETRARSPTRTGSNQPGRPPAAETVPAAIASLGIRRGVVESEKCTPTDFLRNPSADPRTGSSHTPRAAFAARVAVVRVTPVAATIRDATRSTSPAARSTSAATSAAVSQRRASRIRSATRAFPSPRSFEHGVEHSSADSETNSSSRLRTVLIIDVSLFPPASSCSSSCSATTTTPSGLAAADANLARVLFLAAPTESTSPVFSATARRIARAHGAACVASEHPEGSCTNTSSMDAFSTTTPRRVRAGDRRGDSAADASRRREGDAANVSSAFVFVFVFVFVSASAAGASRFANPHTRSSVSAISIEPSTRCIALDALSYGR